MAVGNMPFSGPNLAYSWQVSGAEISGSNVAERVQVRNLPAAGSTFVVSVSVTNPGSGCIASGSRTFHTYTADEAGRLSRFCELWHTLPRLIVPGLINPLGPDGPDMSRILQPRLTQLESTAGRVLALVHALRDSGSSGNRR